jgi:phosphatidylserine decarboxylase
MTARAAIARLVAQEDLNFLLTNRLPRRWLTQCMGRLSRIEQPWFCALGLALWRLFTDLDLHEAKLTRFRSLHAVFTRELKAGARPVDPDPAILVSPCDAILGASGRIDVAMVLQAKGFPYPLQDLLGDPHWVDYYRHGCYATLRLTSAMYHRFHAPAACRLEQVTYVAGDTWNVNPIALRRVERLFCKNERAILRCRLDGSDEVLTLVPVAAILVASIRLHCLDVLLHLRYGGPTVIPCDAHFARGAEMGWFEHGSTILVFAPAGSTLLPHLRGGDRLRMGEALLRRPTAGGGGG